MYGVVVVLWVGVGLCVWGGVGAGVCVHRCKVRFCHAVVSHMVIALSPLSPLLFFLKNLSGGGWVGWDWDWDGDGEWWWRVGCGCGCGGFMLVKFFVGMLAGRQMGRDGR